MKPNTVFSIQDYRTFLSTYAEEKKIQSKSWNYSTWARTLGLKSTSSITKVLSGERKPGPDMVARLVRYFKFSPDEERYFRSLILLDKDRSSFVFQSILERTQQKESSLQRRVLKLFEFRLIAEWHHLAIRELFRLKGFRNETKRIKNLFLSELTEETIQKSVSLLQRLNLLKRSVVGQWNASDEQVLTQNDIPSEATQAFHEQMLDQAKTRVRDVSPDDREYQALTMLIDKKDLPKLKQRIRDFVQGLETEFQNKKVNQLYQMQFQLFPITREFSRYEELVQKQEKE